MVKARWSWVKTCSHCQHNSHIRGLCRVRAMVLRKKTNAKKHLYVNTATKRSKELVVIMLFNFMQNQVLTLQENVDSDSVVRDPQRVLTGTGMNQRMEHFGTNQVRYQLGQQTIAKTTFGVVASCFPIVSGQRLKMRCNKLVFEGECSCIEHKGGNRTELVVQSNVYWLKQSSCKGRQKASCSATWTVSAGGADRPCCMFELRAAFEHQLDCEREIREKKSRTNTKQHSSLSRVGARGAVAQIATCQKCSWSISSRTHDQ